MMKKRVLFIDRDGTIIVEPPGDFQVDSLEKLSFYPRAITNLAKIQAFTNFEMAMVTNQDGLGTSSFQEDTFWPAQNKMIETLAAEGFTFNHFHIDRSFPEENRPTRKPGTAMLQNYFSQEYDLPNSFVIGDRLTDVLLAKNLGSKAIWITTPDAAQDAIEQYGLHEVVALVTPSWETIAHYLLKNERSATVRRVTSETDIEVWIDLDGTGKCSIHTGLGFFDHMLEQIGRHSGCDLTITVKGDLHIDEHHTIEDTALALGEAIRKALGDKRGIERYGFCLPMDDCLCSVALDFGGRPWLVWETDFKREKIGEMPTEMFMHFFKSLSDAALMNLNIKAEGDNEHHKIEGIFKALARAIRMAIRQNVLDQQLPSTKGVL